MIEPLSWYSTAEPEARKRLVNRLNQREKNHFQYRWPVFARPEQLAPTGDWRIWMIMAGRGFGNGTNRLMVGDEIIQFARAEPLGNRKWKLLGLLRGRAGTEAEAAAGHPSQTTVILIDESLVSLDPSDVPALATTRIAAIGAGDAEVVVADLTNAGFSRRPLTPVHPRLVVKPDNSWELCWTRRARGQWRWDAAVDVPLVEEREAYVVGYGPTTGPLAAWSVSEARLQLLQQERSAVLDAHGPGPLWVRQVGTFDQSQPLLLAQLS